MRRLLLATLLVFCGLASADAPEWVRRGQPADKTYKFYVGRSSGTATEQAGFNEATREAYEQAIRENFGFQTRIQSDAYESSKKVVSTKRVQVLSQDIRVFGFEQVDSHQVQKGEKWDVWVLYRYPLAEIAREKSRLATTREQATPEFSEQGSNDAGLKSGTLEVATKPPGASILVDGNAYGVTPMRLKGVLEAGQHKLRVDHPSFETIEEMVVLVPGKTLKVEKALVPALARMAITTEPANATVVINGQPAGTTPLADIEVPADKVLKLEITHAEANPLSTELQVAKDEFNSKHFDLPLKNASLLVRSTPPGAEVFIDGEKAGFTPVGPKTFTAGRHEVRLRKAGFQEEKIDLRLRGAEKRVEDVKLQAAKAGSEPKIWTEMNRGPAPARKSEDLTFVFSFWLPQYRSALAVSPAIGIASWGASLSLFVSRWVALELGYQFGSGSVQDSSAKTTLTSNRVHFGVPIVFWRGSRYHVYVSPDVDLVANRITIRTTGASIDSLGPSGSVWGYGASAGYRYWWGNEPAFGLGLRLGAMNHTGGSGVVGALGFSAALELSALF